MDIFGEHSTASLFASVSLQNAELGSAAGAQTDTLEQTHAHTHTAGFFKKV